MSAIAFDSLLIANRFRNAGFTRKQSEVFAETLHEILDDDIATKGDIKSSEIALMKEIADIRKEIAESKVEIIKWVVGLLLAQTGVIVALVKIIN